MTMLDNFIDVWKDPNDRSRAITFNERFDESHARTLRGAVRGGVGVAQQRTKPRSGLACACPGLAQERAQAVAASWSCEPEGEFVVGDGPRESNWFVRIFAPAVAFFDVRLLRLLWSRPDAATRFDRSRTEIRDVDEVAATGRVVDSPPGARD